VYPIHITTVDASPRTIDFPATTVGTSTAIPILERTEQMEIFLETAWTDNYDENGKWFPKWERYPRSFKNLKNAVNAANRIEGRSHGEAVCRFITTAGIEVNSFGNPV
jgi:hypothetical protein